MNIQTAITRITRDGLLGINKKFLIVNNLHDFFFYYDISASILKCSALMYREEIF